MTSFTRRQPQFGCLTENPKDLEMFIRPNEFRAERRRVWLDRLTGAQIVLGVLMGFALPAALVFMKLSIFTNARILTIDALAFTVLIVVPAYFDRQTTREKHRMLWLLAVGVLINVITFIAL